MKIATAGNTLVPAYLALLAKGYSVSREQAQNESGELWRAHQGDNSFVAEDLVQLLGLVALLETRGESWKATDTEIASFIEQFGEALWLAADPPFRWAARRETQSLSDQEHFASLLSSAIQLDPAQITRDDVPAERGIYVWFRENESDPAYIGKATGTKGLQHRIWGQHLNPKYLEWRQDRWTDEDTAQAAHRVTHNGRLVVEKSAFRKNLARRHALCPGQPVVDFIKANFVVRLLPMGDSDPKGIQAVESAMIRALQPSLNRSGMGTRKRAAQRSAAADWS